MSRHYTVQDHLVRHHGQGGVGDADRDLLELFFEGQDVGVHVGQGGDLRD